MEASREARQPPPGERRDYRRILPMKLATLVHTLRGHREVENQLCLVMAAVFGGGQSRDHTDHCAATPNLTPRLPSNPRRTNAPIENCAEGKRLNAAVKSN
jgi:hypothetical protein